MPDYVLIQDLTIASSIGDNDLFPLSDGSGAYAVKGSTIKSYSASAAVAAAADAASAAEDAALAKAAAEDAVTDAGLAQTAAEAAAESAADAVGEIDNIEAAQNAHNSEIKSALTTITGNTPSFYESGYIYSPGVGGTVDIAEIVPSSATYHSVIPCSEGDVFYVSGSTAQGAAAKVYQVIDANGVVLLSAGNGVTYNDQQVICPANSAYLIAQSRIIYEHHAIKNAPLQYSVSNIEKSLTNSLINPVVADGFMKSTGDLYQTASSAGRLYKYIIPDGVDKIYIDGRSTLTVPSSEYGYYYCAVWFVKNNAMMPNGHVDITVSPQNYNMFEISIPSGAEEIWALSNYTVYISKNYSKAIAGRLYALENEGDSDYFSGAYTASKREQGLRILADAQGCYYIPFNALGLGVNRGNGEYGDNYIRDNIHPTALGGYNLAMGVWSYLKNIPPWFTSIPNSDPSFDGTQWNGKTWYAYGTSLSTESYGGWCNKVASLSGMTVVNKAIAGGALVTNRDIFDALMDTTDGKLNADLITIEVGANDHGDLGDPWSTSIYDFYGALNHCIKEMYAAGVQAQIVIMASTPGRYSSTDPTDKFDVDKLYNDD